MSIVSESEHEFPIYTMTSLHWLHCFLLVVPGGLRSCQGLITLSSSHPKFKFCGNIIPLLTNSCHSSRCRILHRIDVVSLHLWKITKIFWAEIVEIFFSVFTSEHCLVECTPGRHGMVNFVCKHFTDPTGWVGWPQTCACIWVSEMESSFKSFPLTWNSNVLIMDCC